jgi:anti-sigma factor RsiW
MSHQPYEKWLFDEADLSREQAKALQAHLQECQQCQELQETWKNLGVKVQVTPMVSPQPGFSRRWRASLAERRARQQVLQVKRLFIGFLVAALITLLLLAAVLFLTASPVNLLVAVFEEVTHLIIRESQIQHVILPWLKTVPLIIPIAGWVIFSSIFGLLSLFWIYSIWRIHSQGVHKNENSS